MVDEARVMYDADPGFFKGILSLRDMGNIVKILRDQLSWRRFAQIASGSRTESSLSQYLKCYMPRLQAARKQDIDVKVHKWT